MSWMKFKMIYFAISLLFIGIGIYSLTSWGLRVGIDFTGGALVEYKFGREISTESALKKTQDLGIKVSSIQETGDKTYLFKLGSLESVDREKIKNALKEDSEGNIEEIKFENVGPSVGKDLIKKTTYAIGVASVGILLWIAYQFKSIKYGACAILAMFHDSLVLIGLFSLLGKVFGAEVDFLFVTALLTTLSFSVHDTIVVYDRIREAQKKYSDDLVSLANKALSETMVRSLNNSFTIIFMLVALILFGGVTIRWFAVALLIGTISGTYSSPFVAVPLLITWDSLFNKFKNKFRKHRLY
ncbi:MAG: hypothetical protein ACD_57C00124G0001 [uncultured bacterium]|uniref:Protein-export membrane protein SecF n=1 Tax=Candidatus Woesebacteria bacterium RIFCSPLOWO2_01_FULL_39_21 TaxID=1802519 RepID=A0A1F8BDD9_9BACT|nr:MAG: hypothetical protein ACD_57C00124G0001 [uncultured bacterium]OGM22072.1 MAG: protein-export membrane protein SecF [Candidatus Woesebacteria bacterium RIFCSPHIGHO2_01_FULL_39_23]OGM62074.1 MAG: protein-export membrane protein SecF [Candidatus Woesebacteria bacterium RIFCSPLOWO2_01_FULL_39_21]